MPPPDAMRCDAMLVRHATTQQQMQQPLQVPGSVNAGETSCMPQRPFCCTVQDTSKPVSEAATSQQASQEGMDAVRALLVACWQVAASHTGLRACPAEQPVDTPLQNHSIIQCITRLSNCTAVLTAAFHNGMHAQSVSGTCFASVLGTAQCVAAACAPRTGYKRITAAHHILTPSTCAVPK